MSASAAPAPSLFATADNFRNHYTVYGESGPPVIMRHGGGPGASGYSNYNRNIAAFAKRHRTFVIDFPGWGQSSKNLAPGDPFAEGGKAVGAFMKAVGLQKAHLVGNSYGGSAALHLALNNPDMVDKLALMGPGGALIRGQKGQRRVFCKC